MSIELGDIDLLAGVFGFDVATYREVVVLLLDLLEVYPACHVWDILTAGEELDDMCDMLIREDVIIRLLAEEVLAAGIDEANARIGLVLGERKDIHRNTRAVEEVRREGDDTLDIV